MRDNPQSAEPLFFRLPGHGILAMEGRDAASFAHAQFMNDVAGLPVGNWQWNGWLTPKGRLVALFALLKRDEQTLWLLLPDADPIALATALQRFVFRSKVTFEARGDLVASGSFSPPASASHAQIAEIELDRIELDMGADGGPRVLRIGAGADLVPDASDGWAAFDLEHGLPRLPPSQTGQWTPQQLSLDRLRAYSVKKGCYPGQEIVARTHFLGQAKRGLVLFDAEGGIADGLEVRAGVQPLGTLVSVATRAASSIALAVLPLERDEAAILHAGHATLHERALLGGLAR